LSPNSFKPNSSENIHLKETLQNSDLKKQVLQNFTAEERSILFTSRGVSKMLLGNSGNYIPEPATCKCNPDHDGVFVKDCPDAMPTCNTGNSGCSNQTYS